jgi:hypothetical protein
MCPATSFAADWRLPLGVAPGSRAPGVRRTDNQCALQRPSVWPTRVLPLVAWVRSSTGGETPQTAGRRVANRRTDVL